MVIAKLIHEASVSHALVYLTRSGNDCSPKWLDSSVHQTSVQHEQHVR